MSTADATREQIRRLPCWQGSITIEPLEGGITNRNFRVVDSGRTCVVRICEEHPHLGIDRRNELACQRAAHACGVAPAIVHSEPGILVSEFLEGKTLSAADVRDVDVVKRVARTLRKLHDTWDRLSGEMLYFSAFQTVRTYAGTARRSGAELPGDVDLLLEDARELSHRLAPFQPTLCHNDLLAANLIDGDELRLVDWEYGGIGNPLFDLSGVSANCALEPRLEELLVEAYHGGANDVALNEIRILKTVSLLREALWAVIQTVASEIDFDYVKYARDNFEAYREARAALDR